MKSYSYDYTGLAVCRYEGRMRFAWARFSSPELAMHWFTRMKSGVSIARVPMALTIYHQGKTHRSWGEWPERGKSGYGAD